MNKKPSKVPSFPIYYFPLLAKLTFRLGTGRLYIHRDVSEKFLRRFTTAMAQFVVVKPEAKDSALVRIYELALEEISIRKASGRWGKDE